ncbi:MAG: SDR family oxidoreductase [Candidatus Fermentibacteraceae bacterium]
MIDEGPVLVTGATGFIGGFITAELLRRGVRVIAPVRPGGGRSPRDRAAALLEFFGLPPDSPLEAVEGFVDRPGLGLARPAARRIRNEVGTVMHCAADTSFAARRRDRVHRVNVRGLENVFHSVGDCRRFWHMSTAYSVGSRPGTYAEELRPAREFNNQYERSKHLAERRITELCRETSTRLMILRPSVVYGDSGTGASLSFNALYYAVRTLLFIRDTMLRDIRERGGDRARRLGVSAEADGRTRMPVSLPGGGELNVIPVDYLVGSVMALAEADGEGIYHIVSRRPSSVSALIGYIETCFGIYGLEVSDDYRRSEGGLQTMVNGYMELYYPYFCDGRTFEDTRARSVLDPAGITCPELSLPVFRRCMEYAVGQDWGAGQRI